MTWVDTTILIGGVIIIAGVCANYFNNYFKLKKQHDAIEEYKQSEMYKKQLQMVQQLQSQQQSKGQYKQKEEPKRNQDVYQ